MLAVFYGYLLYIWITEDDIPIWTQFFIKTGPFLMLTYDAHLHSHSIMATYILYTFLTALVGLTVSVSLLSGDLMPKLFTILFITTSIIIHYML